MLGGLILYGALFLIPLQ
ncbi:hypothetical protein CGLO_12109 [Colletotrichum gloeosporioides Cg-14]|uniref:Uncharacterized protein n=1 Tax=Colletotrichum gloeosporioides (strain Cg-14) TaxID=1237896 RepID=T0K6Q3_COLGC|nr:hypothetical protein CGLO_12109 [Colletotrichum gloeosporioides Cg-14]